MLQTILHYSILYKEIRSSASAGPSSPRSNIPIAFSFIYLLGRDLDLTIINGGLDVPGALSVNGAANREGSSEDLLNGSRELTGHTALTHGTSNFNDLVEGDVTVVNDVLHLLAVTNGLVEGLHDQRRGRGDDTDGSLTVLHGELNGHVQSLPVHGGFLDILTDLLGGETEGTNLGGEGRSATNFATNGAHDHDLNVS
mmetsp:Transcript_28408/g.44167  ORF Transcript_28408/g.44167 Transcript_28408/m.44167 type:complete len:198 (+) Transcript_28408:51-644(+)